MTNEQVIAIIVLIAGLALCLMRGKGLIQVVVGVCLICASVGRLLQ